MSIVDKVKNSYGPVEGGERECELGPEGFASESEHVNITRTDDMAVSTLTGGEATMPEFGINKESDLTCLPCEGSNTNVETQHDISSSVGHSFSWFKLKQCIAAHKNEYPIGTRLSKERFTWAGVEETATSVRLALIDHLQHANSFQTRPTMQRLRGEILKAADHWANTPAAVWQNESLVYARLNLNNKEIYIGSTNNWGERFREHQRETMKHYKGACKGCGMHHAYKRQGKLHPAEWIMVPLQFSNKIDLLQNEKRQIYKHRSNLNSEIYGGKARDNHNARRSRMRKRGKPSGAAQAMGGASTPAPTVYKLTSDDAFTSSSLTGLMSYLECYEYGKGKEGVISWERHRESDKTNWKLLDFKHGQCVVSWNGTEQTLREAMPEVKQSTNGQLTITNWNIKENTKATEKMLGKLACKRWKVQDYLTFTATQHKALWVHMELMEDDKKRKTVRERLYRICCEVYGFMPFRKLKFQAPFSPLLKRGEHRRFIVATLQPILRQVPAAISTYILQNLKITRRKRPKIGDFLINFRKHAKENTGACTCKRTKGLFRKNGWATPMKNGHVAFIGSQYEGPFKRVLQQNCNNTPMPTVADDVKMAAELWAENCSKLPRKWKEMLQDNGVVKGLSLNAEQRGALPTLFKSENLMSTVSMKEMTNMKRLLRGLCVSTIDKNAGQLHCCCPALYKEVMDKTFDTTKVEHYESVLPKLFSEEYANNHEKQLQNIYKGEPLEEEIGGEEDIIQYWKWLYYKNRWNTIAPFNEGGKIGNSYTLFKFKYWETPSAKWNSGRPISPSWQHPMATLLKAAGRAWMFIIKQWRTEHFILNSAMGLREAVEGHIGDMKARAATGQLDLKHKVWDIDSMYPSMPKGDMICAMKTILKEVREGQRLRVSHITVPDSKALPIKWGKHYEECEGRARAVTVPLDELVKIVKFSLDHTVTKVGKDKLVRQNCGIPMGDSLSPAIAIGTCAWFERKWIRSMPEEDRWRVKGIRYLDDVLMIVNDHEWGKAGECFDNFAKLGGCYPKPLSLSEDDGAHYLECTIHNKGEDLLLQHWNKNEGNESKQRYYKGVHAHSFSETKYKVGALIGTFVRMGRNSSTNELLQTSLKEKCRELKFLQYPMGHIKHLIGGMKERFPQFEWAPTADPCTC